MWGPPILRPQHPSRTQVNSSVRCSLLLIAEAFYPYCELEAFSDLYKDCQAKSKYGLAFSLHDSFTVCTEGKRPAMASISMVSD